MTVEEIQGIRKAAIIILLVIISWLAAIGLFATCLWLHDWLTERPRVCSKAVKAKMRYHGIEAAFEDHKGNWYFIRKGERVRL